MYQWCFNILVIDSQTRIVARGISAMIEHIRAKVRSWASILIHIDHTYGFRLVLAISSALKLNFNYLDIKTTFLNGEIPENEQFFCSPPPGF